LEKWVVGSEPSKRYPLWTRANVGEVFPDPVSPLSHSLLLRPGTEPAWRDALVKMGAFTHDEFDPDNMETVGVFGSYCYLNASLTRILGERGPGMSAQIMDDLFFGSMPGVPPYVEAPGDKNEERTAAIGKTFEWVMTTQSLDELAEDAVKMDALHRSRPNLEALSNEDLWKYTQGLFAGHFRRLFSQHIFITFISPVPVGALQQICEAVGRPGDTMRVISGVGDVESAAPAMAMWKLGRLVAADAGLTGMFNQGVSGLLERLHAAGTPATEAFLAGFADFIDKFGARGPNEWEIRHHTWETRPELPLAAIDRMRLAGKEADPVLRNKAMAAERDRIRTEIAELLARDPATQGMFLAAAKAAVIFQAGRERSKTNCVKLIQEARMAMHLLGRRMVAAGQCDEMNDFGMLKDTEFLDWLRDPARFREEIRRRRALLAEYESLQEPFIFEGTIPDPSTWPKRSVSAVEAAKVGDILGGLPGCPGQATGIARVVLDPGDPTALEAGDILVAPSTDPSWTPLFVSAGGVIVDVGAAQSHAMIVSRELGIPCVPSVTNGTRRIPDGAMVLVDGDAGTVTILALP
jgi:rifampicin phosphotransferase